MTPEDIIAHLNKLKEIVARQKQDPIMKQDICAYGSGELLLLGYLEELHTAIEHPNGLSFNFSEPPF